MLKKIAFAAAATLALSAGAGTADDYEKYGEAEGWTVWANKTTGGCFIENRNNNGNTVQMGVVTAKDKLAFIGLWNNADAIMEPGEERDMSLDVDGNAYSFRAKANDGTVTGGMTGGYMYLNNPAFIADVENGQTLTIHADAERSVAVDLTGTKKAIAMSRECFAAQNG